MASMIFPAFVYYWYLSFYLTFWFFLPCLGDASGGTSAMANTEGAAG